MKLPEHVSDYEAPPLGFRRAVCVNFFDLGYQPSADGYPLPKWAILFELEDTKSDGVIRHTVVALYTASRHPKSNLRRDLESWRGKPFTDEELEEFDSENLVGVNALLKLVEKPKRDGGTTVVVDSIHRPDWPMREIVAKTPRTYMPEFVQKMIEKQLPPPAAKAQVRKDAAAAAPRADAEPVF